MYHPYEPWPATQPAKTTNDSEYIEIHNAGTGIVDLTDYRFDNGVTFSFDAGTTLYPGAYLVVCGNISAFTSHYPTVSNYVGNFGGQLDNGGERITLSRFNGSEWLTADTIKYIDGGPADGDGPSLELIHPGFARLSDQYYGDWAPSTTTNGTPGRRNSVYTNAPLPVVGDVLHSPPLPPANSAITITCRATGRDGDPLSSVTLEYRKDQTSTLAWTNVLMNDEGLDGDAQAHDGVYTVRLPEYLKPTFTNGEQIEFRIVAADALGSRRFPATNTAGAVTRGPYSYLCAFGEDTFSDCAYPGEYRTYHILMTRTNKVYLETRPVASEEILDCTFIAPDGEIFYNSGTRLRGGSSRNALLGNYRVQVPRGRNQQGETDLNFNYDQAFNQYLGMTIMANSGYGCHASDVSLARVWLNEERKDPSQHIYCRLEKFDTDYVARKGFPSPYGNLYTADGDSFRGDLRVVSPLSAYWTPGGYSYIGETNNPYTMWNSLSNLTYVLSLDAATYPTNLSSRMNVRQWAREFATQVCIDDNEAGIGNPASTYGDELRLYCNPLDNQFYIFPWDYSEAFASRSLVWGWTLDHVKKFLFNRPILPYYAGDCRDVMETVMSETNMAAVFNGMGSKFQTAAYRPVYESRIATQRTGVFGLITTNFTVNINGAAPGFPVTLLAPVMVSAVYTVEPVSQRTNAWVRLGSFEFSATANEYVEVTRVADTNDIGTYYTVADAVMFSNATATVKVDDADVSRFSTTGSWGPNQGSFQEGIGLKVSTAAGSTARWAPSLPTAGVYAVYVRCSAAVGFPPNKPTDRFVRYVVVARQSHPLATASGTAPQAYTDRVLVNGVNSTIWSNQSSSWSATDGTVLLQTVNDLRVEAVDPEGRVLRSTNMIVVANRNPQTQGGTISANTTWSNTNGIIYVASNVDVTAGAKLTIDPGNVVVFASGRRIRVTAGTLDVHGSPASPVYLCASNGSLFVEAAGAGTLVTGRYFTAVGAAFSASSGGRLVLEDATLTNSPAGSAAVSAASAAEVTLRRCIVSGYATMAFTSTPVVVEQCLLEGMTQSGLEFSNSATTRVTRTTLQNARGATAVDGLRFSACPAGIVTNCMIRNLTGAAVSFSSSAATISGSLLYQCGTGIVVQGSAATNGHNTVASCWLGLRGALSDTRSSILWDLTNAVAGGPATVAYCDVQLGGTNVYAGAGNLNRTPWFRSTAEEDYRLQEISPCLDSGESATAMGASFPVGACPASPSALTLTNVTDANIVLRWQDNSDDETRFEAERSQDGGPWTVVTNLPANSTSWTNSGLSQETVYRYRVRAAHNRGRSLPSEEAEVLTPVSTTTQLLRDNLRITEIMYNPAPGDTAAQACEFLELGNIGTNTLNLSGLYFENGMTHVFPPGASLAGGAFRVLVKDPAAFTNRYGVPYQGIYTGSLNNAGERLRIKDSGSNTIVDVDQYNPGSVAGWYTSADGNGYSLVLANPDGDMGNPATWRPSTAVNGSPGQADADPGYGTVLINELLSHQDADNPGDWIELYNAGTGSVNITGWYLSDSAANLKKFQIGNTNIPAHGYCLFSEYQHFGTNRLGANGFGLSELGDEVCLSSATNGVLTSYRTWVKFGASERDVTFGRCTRSEGEVDFTSLSAQTPGASNAYPKVGPVVINEIMYNPSAGGKEYVEIYNLTASTVKLYDTLHPTNMWRFDGAFEYVFPAGRELKSHEYALIVSTDPAEFRALFGLTGSTVQVFGPFNGALANNGETVKLYKPGDPELDGAVPQYLVDRVQYNDKAPWPAAADNGGPSLERVAADRYGNDPTNWRAGTVGGTPGATNNSAGLPSVAFLRPDDVGMEAAATVTVHVTLAPAVSETVTVKYAVSGGSAGNGADYALPPGTLVFWPYETLKSVPLVIYNDSAPEPDETVEVTFTSVTANAQIGGNRTFTYTIVDNDASSLAAPVITPAGTTQFSNSIVVTMTSSNPDATIRYTTDGTRPEFGDPVYAGPFVLDYGARVTARTFLGSYNTGAWSSALFIAATPPPGYEPSEPSNQFSVSVSASSDDAEQLLSGTMLLALPSLNLGRTKDAYSAAGFRFAHVGVPSGVTVTNAFVQFASVSNGAGAVSLTIYGQAADNPSTFTSANSDITARPRTTNSLSWSPAAWGAGEIGSPERTPDIGAVIREVVARPGWATSNSIALLFVYGTSDDLRLARSVDGAPASAARLTIMWATNTPSSFWLSVSTNGNGAVTGGNRSFPAGSNATAEAYASRLYHFGGWAGDVGTSDTNLVSITVLMDRDRSLTANFLLDPVTILGATFDAGTFGFYWPSVTEAVYAVYRTANLAAGWPAQPLTGGIPGDVSGTNVFTEGTLTNGGSFYRINATVP